MSKIEDALEKATNLRQISLADVRAPEPVLPATPSLPEGSGHLRYGIWLGLILLIGLGGYHLAGNISAPERAAPRPAALPETQKAALRQPLLAHTPAQPFRLPGCIPLNAPDAMYAAAHPGWQSYKTPALEFRVFRQGAAVQAIQVISLQGGAITGEFFRSFLGELAANAFQVRSAEGNGGFLIERGVLGAAAQVTVYRRKSSGEIRAVVVAYQ